MTTGGRKKVVAGSTRPQWVAPSTALLALVAMAGAFAGYDGLGQDPPNALMGWGGIAGVVIAAGLVAFLTVATKREIRVDRDGIMVRIGLAKPVQIEWSEPHDYFYRSYTGTSTPSVEDASVSTPDGRHIDVDNIKLPDHPNAHLPALVEQYSTAANLPKIKKRLKAGEEVAFGQVGLTRDEIKLEDRSQSWEAGVSLQIDDGRLKMSVDGKWISSQVAVREVANYPCLLRAIGQIRHARAPT